MKSRKITNTNRVTNTWWWQVLCLQLLLRGAQMEQFIHYQLVPERTVEIGSTWTNFIYVIVAAVNKHYTWIWKLLPMEFHDVINVCLISNQFSRFLDLYIMYKVILIYIKYYSNSDTRCSCGPWCSNHIYWGVNVYLGTILTFVGPSEYKCNWSCRPPQNLFLILPL